MRPMPGASLTPEQVEWVDHARVFLRDGTVLELTDATISPDSIVGFGGSMSARLALTRRDVERVDTRSTESFTPFLGGALAFFAGLFLMIRAGNL
jgi:hypothetical protein